ncbi:MAG: hypothetical protein KIT09_25140 [Bryobacteraceae bacterium]|nr:hypothetical protein [Bryobacteraceae bacterium]
MLVRLRPAGPWRFGSDSGDRDGLAPLYHSDTLFSAVTAAMATLGKLDDWLTATALAAGQPDVRFTSLFPWQGDLLYISPPRNVWPPASTKVRTKGAAFAPLPVVAALLAGTPFDEDRWTVDGESRCLLFTPGKAQPTGPFRQAMRAFAAVDRLRPGVIAPHRAACIEFSPDSGLWCFAAFRDDDASGRWSGYVEGAFRLLADSGFGGRRSIGWGRAVVEEARTCSLRDLVLAPPPADRAPDETVPAPPPATAYWLLSLFRPGQNEAVDWREGAYSLITRGGRTESLQGWGRAKKQLRMVEEGSVVLSAAPPDGSAADVAPDGFPHPVFRYGYAVAIALPERPVQ